MAEERKLGLSGEDVKHKDEGPGLAGLLKAMGNKDADAEAIEASPDGDLIKKKMSVMAMGEDSPEGKAYWASYEKGLTKKVYGEGTEKWASYIPLAADKEPGRKFPLIFCLHGAHNPIQLTESYGIVQLAAKEECIVIAPENENLGNILSLLEYAEKNYPVDPEKVFAMGYSFGGCMSSRTVLARPDIFAGAGMGGMLFAGKMPAHELDNQHYEGYELTEEMLEKAEKLRMPGLLFMGENEMLNLLPLWKNQEYRAPDGAIPLESEDKQKSFNNWRRAAGCAPAEFLKEGEVSDNPVEMSLGVRFDRTEVREYYGRKYFIGDSLDQNGECLLRTVGVEKMVHWATEPFAELIWEQIGKYRRNRVTGELTKDE